MKKSHIPLISGLIGLMVLFVMTTAHATGFSPDLVARVPFAFTAGDTTLPPGTYTVTRPDNSPGVLSVRGKTGGIYLLSETHETHDPAESQLVFRRYGDHYFLHTVRFLQDDAYRLPETKHEREMKLARNEPASTVIVDVAGGPSRVIDAQ